MYGSLATNVKTGTLVVLAGGRGRRLGGIAKGLIRLPSGETLIERLLSLASGSPRLVSTNDPQAYEWLDVPLVADLFPDRGAPGGVVTALACAATEWVTIVACDMPLVDSDTLEELEAARDESVDAVCFERDGHLEPLVACYRRSLVFDWAARLDGNPSLHELLESTRLRVLTPADPRVLQSLNAPTDLTQTFRSNSGSGTLAAKSHAW